MKKEKILFIWGRYYAGRLYTMPFGLNVLYYLLVDGYDVDIFFMEYPSNKYDDILKSKPKINFIGNLLKSSHTKVKYWRIALSFLFKFKYKNIIAVGQMGAVAAQAIPGKHKNIAYFNDEFPSIYNRPYLQKKEIALINRAHVIALPDFCRLQGLENDIKSKISSEKLIEFTNSPCWINLETVTKQDWHSRLGIAKDKKIVLSSGGIDPALQLTEILTSVKSWDDEFVLVMNSKTLDGLNHFRENVKHLQIDNKIIWLNEVLTEAEFHSLIADSFCNICLYSNLNQNLYTVGKSSGKAMRSILLGIPVICSNFPSLGFIKDNGLGICIDHPLDILDALHKIKIERTTFSNNCLLYAKTNMNTKKEYHLFMGKFLRTITHTKPQLT